MLYERSPIQRSGALPKTAANGPDTEAATISTRLTTAVTAKPPWYRNGRHSASHTSRNAVTSSAAMPLNWSARRANHPSRARHNGSAKASAAPNSKPTAWVSVP